MKRNKQSCEENIRERRESCSSSLGLDHDLNRPVHPDLDPQQQDQHSSVCPSQSNSGIMLGYYIRSSSWKLQPSDDDGEGENKVGAGHSFGNLSEMSDTVTGSTTKKGHSSNHRRNESFNAMSNQPLSSRANDPWVDSILKNLEPSELQIDDTSSDSLMPKDDAAKVASRDSRMNRPPTAKRRSPTQSRAASENGGNGNKSRGTGSSDDRTTQVVHSPHNDVTERRGNQRSQVSSRRQPDPEQMIIIEQLQDMLLRYVTENGVLMGRVRDLHLKQQQWQMDLIDRGRRANNGNVVQTNEMHEDEDDESEQFKGECPGQDQSQSHSHSQISVETNNINIGSDGNSMVGDSERNSSEIRKVVKELQEQVNETETDNEMLMRDLKMVLNTSKTVTQTHKVELQQSRDIQDRTQGELERLKEDHKALGKELQQLQVKVKNQSRKRTNSQSESSHCAKKMHQQEEQLKEQSEELKHFKELRDHYNEMCTLYQGACEERDEVQQENETLRRRNSELEKTSKQRSRDSQPGRNSPSLEKENKLLESQVQGLKKSNEVLSKQLHDMLAAQREAAEAVESHLQRMLMTREQEWRQEKLKLEERLLNCWCGHRSSPSVVSAAAGSTISSLRSPSLVGGPAKSSITTQQSISSTRSRPHQRFSISTFDKNSELIPPPSASIGTDDSSSSNRISQTLAHAQIRQQRNQSSVDHNPQRSNGSNSNTSSSGSWSRRSGEYRTSSSGSSGNIIMQRSNGSGRFIENQSSRSGNDMEVSGGSVVNNPRSRLFSASHVVPIVDDDASSTSSSSSSSSGGDSSSSDSDGSSTRSSNSSSTASRPGSRVRASVTRHLQKRQLARQRIQSDIHQQTGSLDLSSLLQRIDTRMSQEQKTELEDKKCGTKSSLSMPPNNDNPIGHGTNTQEARIMPRFPIHRKTSKSTSTGGYDEKSCSSSGSSSSSSSNSGSSSDSSTPLYAMLEDCGSSRMKPANSASQSLSDDDLTSVDMSEHDDPKRKGKRLTHFTIDFDSNSNLPLHSAGPTRPDTNPNAGRRKRVPIGPAPMSYAPPQKNKPLTFAAIRKNFVRNTLNSSFVEGGRPSKMNQNRGKGNESMHKGHGPNEITLETKAIYYDGARAKKMLKNVLNTPSA